MYATRTGFAEELMAYIYEAHAMVPPAERRNSHWVMNLEWFLEVRDMADSRGLIWQPSVSVAGPETMLGLPIEIRDDGGAPHLEVKA